MPVETEKTTAAVAPATPKKKPSGTSGKAAIAKVTLLDGSLLEVTIDVSIK
jgi:band 4.1-like protein 1/2/3